MTRVSLKKETWSVALAQRDDWPARWGRRGRHRAARHERPLRKASRPDAPQSATRTLLSVLKPLNSVCVTVTPMVQGFKVAEWNGLWAAGCAPQDRPR